MFNLLLHWGRYLPVFFLSYPLFAQDYSYINYSVKDGLAGSMVYSMARDKDGFIWFGTETGLSRFDGTHFRNFYTTDGLPNNIVIRLFVDSKNRVWIIPFKNALCYYQNGRIHTQENDSLLRNLKIDAEVFSVVEDGAGNICVAETKAVHIIGAGGKVTDIREFEGSPFGVMQGGLNSKGEYRFLINNKRHNILIDLDGASLRVAGGFDHPTWPNNSNSTYIGPRFEIHEDGDSLVFSHPNEGTSFKVLMPKGFNSVSGIDDSCATINTYTATFLINTNQGKIIDSFLIGKTVNSVIEDPEGGLWFSTLGEGVNRVSTTDVLRYTFGIGNMVFPVFCIKKIDSKLYVGTDHFYLWELSHNRERPLNLHVDTRFSRGGITAMARMDKHGILIGTDAGVFEWQGPGKKAELLWQRGAVKSLFAVDDSTLLECSSMNARLMRPKGRKVVDTIWKIRSTCGCLQGGSYYMGTLNGLFVIGKDRAPVYLGDRYDALKARIADIRPGPDGAVWVATDGEGLAVCKDGRLVGRLTTEDGLTSNICRTVFIAGRDTWVGTDRGLNKVEVGNKGYTITQFTTADGLSSDLINAIYVEGDTVYACTSEGINQFKAGRLFKRSICNLQITGIGVAGKEWPSDTTDFMVPHKENELEFSFAGISYKSGGSISYHYRLLGLEENWKTSEETVLHYPALPSGKYELEVFAVNKFWVRSQTRYVRFGIDQLLWERSWFRILAGLAGLALIGLFFQSRIRVIRRKEAEKLATAVRIAELEQVALISRMNPHFIFNCLNSIRQCVLDKDMGAANEFIAHFSRLIRQTLNISSHSRISLRVEIDYISSYMELERRRFENRFAYELRVATDVPVEDYYIPPMILQPFIENAILHGVGNRRDEKGRIEIRIGCVGDRLVCRIEDNGVGRKQAAQYKTIRGMDYESLGTALTTKRITMLNATFSSPISVATEDMEDPEGCPAGTCVSIGFPLGGLTEMS